MNLIVSYMEHIYLPKYKHSKYPRVALPVNNILPNTWTKRSYIAHRARCTVARGRGLAGRDPEVHLRICEFALRRTKAFCGVETGGTDRNGSFSVNPPMNEESEKIKCSGLPP